MEIIPEDFGDGFVVSFPDLPGCLTIGDTVQEAIDLSEDAKRCWFEACLEDAPEKIKEPSTNVYSGNYKVRMPKSIHRRLALEANREGVSINQLCLSAICYYLGISDVR